VSLTIPEITKYLDEINIHYQYTGTNDLLIDNYCMLSEPKMNCITWIKEVKDYNFSNVDSKLKMLFITNYFDKINLYNSYNFIECDKPKETYFEILKKFFVAPDERKIERDSIIETECMGKNASIGHHCFICREVTIGNNVTIKNNVVIQCPTYIGDDTIIWDGVVIGADGYGYFRKDDGINYKVPHLGGVKIGKNVEIGSNTTIARGTLGDTSIGNNVKIGVLCCISHNVVIEDNVMLTASVTLAGSSVLKENVYVAPGAVILNQISVGKNAFITAGAIAMKDVKENTSIYCDLDRVHRVNKDNIP